MAWPESEQDLARPLVAWLTEWKWDVYQEVRHTYAAPVADIVAVQGNVTWVIECKRTLGLAVMKQACYWLHWAHYVSCAVPAPKQADSQEFAMRLLRNSGIGLLRIQSWADGTCEVNEAQKPQIHRTTRYIPTRMSIKNMCTEEHKTYCEAGTANGGYLTPFAQTCDRMRRYVRSHPGVTLKDLIDHIPTHYGASATARSCLAKYAEAGIIKGVIFTKEQGQWRLRPEEAS